MSSGPPGKCNSPCLRSLNPVTWRTHSAFGCIQARKKTWRLFEETGQRSAQFEAAAVLGRAGLLDTTHSIGGRLHQGGCKFDREAIRSAYREMASVDWHPLVYSNHGSREDRQNVAGQDWADYQEGDKPGSDLYHLDLTLAHGTRFFWCDPDYTSSYAALNAEIDTECGLFVSDTGRDGNRFIRFRRWLGDGLPYGPSLCNFGHQLSQVLASRNPGYSVIYQHLGVERLETGRPAQAHLPPLRSDAAAALNELAAAQASGDILVTTTARLLSHAAIMTARPWSMTWDGSALNLQFEKSFELGGVSIDVKPDDLAGWAIELPFATELRATLGSTLLEISRFESGGQQYAGMPWHRIDMGKAMEDACRAMSQQK